VNEGLTRIEWRDGKLATSPRLARDWKFSSNGWRIHLSPDAKWSDGTPLDAQQFLNGWESVLAQCKKNGESEGLFFIQNARAVCDGKLPFAQFGARRLDAHTLLIQTNVTGAVLPFRLAHPALFPQRKRFDGDYPPTLGPFRIDSASPMVLTLARNPFYLPEPVALSGVELQTVGSSSTRVEKFLAKETDLVDDLPASSAAQFSSSPFLKTVPTGRTLVLDLSRGNLPRNLRVALLKAFDPEELKGFVRPPLSAPFLLPFDAAFFQAPRVNLSNAKKLWLDGPRLESLRISLERKNDEEGVEVMENLRAQWAKNLSIRVDVVPAGMASVELRDIAWDIYDPSGGADAELKARIAEGTIVPLYQRSRYVLRSPKAEKLEPLPGGSWDFQAGPLQQGE